MATDFDPRTLETVWGRYQRAATAAHAPFPTYLDVGATTVQIALSEQAVNCAFPPDLRHLLNLHNGSREYQVLPGWELFSADRIVDEWKIWEDLYRTQFKPENYSCEPAGLIKGDEWWRMRWIPFCGDGGGNHLCVDMDPAEGGVIGQVITMWHDDPSRTVVATSLTKYIEMIADEFERGALTWDNERDGVYEAE
jgi:cell wall assembly regulator SMI1